MVRRHLQRVLLCLVGVCRSVDNAQRNGRFRIRLRGCEQLVLGYLASIKEGLPPLLTGQGPSSLHPAARRLRRDGAFGALERNFASCR